MLRIIFFGTPRFASTILETLIEKKANVIAVVTKPDKPVGRSQTPRPPDVKVVAEKYNLPVFQPQKASTPEFAEILKNLNPDIFVVAAYSEIFKENLLTLPPIACINVHASILPKYRGAAPVHRAVIEGEKLSGVTIMAMAKELDAGEILSIATIPISEEMTSGELMNELAHLGSTALLKVLQQFEEGTVTRTKQDVSQVTYAAKVKPEEAEVDWNSPANVIHNHIRGMSPKPGAWCWIELDGERKRLLLKKSIIEPNLQGQPGTLLSKNSLIVACQKGAINLLEIQLEGKKALSAAEFLRGISKKEITFPLKKRD